MLSEATFHSDGSHRANEPEPNHLHTLWPTTSQLHRFIFGNPLINPTEPLDGNKREVK